MRRIVLITGIGIRLLLSFGDGNAMIGCRTHTSQNTKQNICVGYNSGQERKTNNERQTKQTERKKTKGRTRERKKDRKKESNTKEGQKERK